MVRPRASRCIGTQMFYVLIWFEDAKDLHEYVHENVTWDHVNVIIICKCQDKKIWRCQGYCQGFSCKIRQGMLYRRLLKMWKIQTYANADRLSCRETCTNTHSLRTIFARKIDRKNEAGMSMSVTIDTTSSWCVSLLVLVSSVPAAPPAMKIKEQDITSREN